MFYIKKNDKPNFIEKIFNIVKVKRETIIVPITSNTRPKKIDKLAKKTIKIIEKKSNSRKVVLSKNIKEESIFINYLNTYGLEIQNGRWLFEILLPEIVEYIVKKKNLENIKISILINDLNEIEYENIKILAKKYKLINVVTNHLEKFRKLKRDLEEYEGIIITTINNKKKSLMKSDIILNIDFPNELFNKYAIKEDSIIVNVRGKIKINKKRFNGLNINDYEIQYKDYELTYENSKEIYFNKDIYEAQFYKKQKINNIRQKVKKDNVLIKYLVLNNGKM